MFRPSLLLCRLLPVLLASSLMLSGCRNRMPGNQASGLPNLVLIVVDTLRADYLGCYGHPRGLSPHIDSLAGDGIVFDNAVCTTPITGPSHAALFTSRYPSELGVVANSAVALPPEVPVLAELLQQAGYRTAATVAIAPIKSEMGFNRGFDHYRQEHLFNTWIAPAGQMLPTTLQVLEGLTERSGDSPVEPFFLWSHLADPHEPYNAHGLVERTAEVTLGGRYVATVSTSSSEVSLLDLHLRRGTNELLITAAYPFKVRRLSLRRRGWIKPSLDPEQAPDGYVSEHRVTITSWRNRRVTLVIQLSDRIEPGTVTIERYSREVAYADRHVGSLVEALRSEGLYDDAVIVFTSDHGEALGCHGYATHAKTLYDCMVRVPLIIKPARGQGFTVPQRRSDAAGLVDLVPTLLDLVQIAPPAAIRGRDLLAPAPPQSEPVLFMETHPPHAHRNLYGLRGERYAVIFDADNGNWELYDVRQDPSQETNLFNPTQELSQAWQRRLLNHLQQTGLQLQTSGEPEYDEETKEMLRGLGYL